MGTVPRPVRDRFGTAIKGHARLTAQHARQITTLKSVIAGIQPGDWKTITLSAGWSNTADFIPAQVRILQNGMSQVIGHIQGGFTGEGTTIGSLPAGYYNTAHKATLLVRIVAGAAAVGKVGAGSVTDSNVLPAALPTASVPVSDHTIGGPPYILGPSGVQFQNIPPGSATASTRLENNAVVVTTVLSNNTPVLTLTTAGQLMLSNVDSSATQISFSELIPLTA